VRRGYSPSTENSNELSHEIRTSNFFSQYKEIHKQSPKNSENPIVISITETRTRCRTGLYRIPESALELTLGNYVPPVEETCAYTYAQSSIIGQPVRKHCSSNPEFIKVLESFQILPVAPTLHVDLALAILPPRNPIPVICDLRSHLSHPVSRQLQVASLNTPAAVPASFECPSSTSTSRSDSSSVFRFLHRTSLCQSSSP
jgi:hypothetical protein